MFVDAEAQLEYYFKPAPFPKPAVVVNNFTVCARLENKNSCPHLRFNKTFARYVFFKAETFAIVINGIDTATLVNLDEKFEVVGFSGQLMLSMSDT